MGSLAVAAAGIRARRARVVRADRSAEAVATVPASVAGRVRGT